MNHITPKEYARLRKRQGRSKHFRLLSIRVDPVLDQMIRDAAPASLDTWVPTLIINQSPAFRQDWKKGNREYDNEIEGDKDQDEA